MKLSDSYVTSPLVASPPRPALPRVPPTLNSELRTQSTHRFIHPRTLKLYKLLLVVLGVALWIGCVTFMVEEDAGFPEGSWTYAMNLQDATVGQQFSWCYWKVLRCANEGRPPQLHETNNELTSRTLNRQSHERSRNEPPLPRPRPWSC